MPDDDLPLDHSTLEELEQLAADFAHLAGVEITAARERTFLISYKALGADDERQLWTDPVTEVDRDVEKIIRDQLAARFPDHTVIGEEMETARQEGDFVWAIDPIDGTANFVNGFPLFAASIGLLYKGRPIVGAVWCSASHRLLPGVYHARLGGDLHFDGQSLVRSEQPGIRRKLVGLPGSGPTGPYDMRKSGSAAVECAYVAAGLLAAARFSGANLWDVAGGAALVEAAGGTVLERVEEEWIPLRAFNGAGPGEGKPEGWHGDLIIAGTSEAAAVLQQSS